MMPGLSTEQKSSYIGSAHFIWVLRLPLAPQSSQSVGVFNFALQLHHYVILLLTLSITIRMGFLFCTATTYTTSPPATLSITIRLGFYFALQLHHHVILFTTLNITIRSGFLFSTTTA
jgi:hypothetical protein